MAEIPGVDAHQRLVGIPGRDRLQDVGARRNDLLDAIAGLKFEVLHQAEEQRIGHRDCEQVFLQLQRDAGPLERDVLRDQTDDGRVGRVFGEIDVGEPELVGERLGDLSLRGEIQPDEHHAEPFARAFVLGQSRPEIVFADETRLNEGLTEFFAHSLLGERGLLLGWTHWEARHSVEQNCKAWHAFCRLNYDSDAPPLSCFGQALVRR